MSIGVLINHTISFLTSPIAVSLALIAAGVIAGTVLPVAGESGGRGAMRRRIGICLAAVGLVWLWFMSSGLAYRWLGLGLEREFPPRRVGELPAGDAIVILGGGVGGNTNTLFYTELFPAADRVVHAARVWKAGKAPFILASGTNELVATVPLLLELGVPRDAIRVENRSGNTEENARCVADLLLAQSPAAPEKGVRPRPKILLVTSSWHMRRALLMFRKYAKGVEVVPAACDYEATVGSDEFDFLGSLLPSADNLLRNSYMLKEIIGYWGYRLLRR